MVVISACDAIYSSLPCGVNMAFMVAIDILAYSDRTSPLIPNTDKGLVYPRFLRELNSPSLQKPTVCMC